MLFSFLSTSYKNMRFKISKQVAEIIANQSNFIHWNSLFQMRTQLLWWKEAGYSISLKGSYKTLKVGYLQVVISNDYSSFVPSMYPSSVDYFLKETHNSICPSGETSIEIISFLKSIEENIPELKSILDEHSGDEGRVTLLDFIKGLVHGKFKVEQFKTLVGIDELTKTSLTELTIWLFHDFHSVKI